ncbi:MAG: phosphoglucosamine mutase [Oscillospiraceae bacterium]|nr:phosphoglucosamine mutase [Oscillospiraceae bacterium]
MGKLFGTDGIRGVVNCGLNPELAYQVGLAAAYVLAETRQGRPLISIGKDTRISSDMLEGALIAGLCAAGADVLHLGVLPTPAVAWITAENHADAGIVISASHNSFEDNGIKIFNGEGFKLSDAIEGRIENMILSDTPIAMQSHGNLGRVIYADQKEIECYLDHLADTVDEDLHGLRVLVDCANGAASTTAQRLFARFHDLHVDIINAKPNGININDACGSTHMEMLRAGVKAGSYDLGLAFDGDADRCLAVDETGEDIDGDQIMAVCSLALKEAGALPGNTLVATVMSNMGLHVFCREHGIHLLCTDVGDRNVLERMRENGYHIGGEQSGHMIFLAHATTGDGQLAALHLLQNLVRSGMKASELVAGCRRYPQVLVNVKLADAAQKEAVMQCPELCQAIADEDASLRGRGRVLVRPSGTENLIRVMVEAETREEAQNSANKLSNLINKSIEE